MSRRQKRHKVPGRGLMLRMTSCFTGGDMCSYFTLNIQNDNKSNTLSLSFLLAADRKGRTGMCSSAAAVLQRSTCFSEILLQHTLVVASGYFQ